MPIAELDCLLGTQSARPDRKCEVQSASGSFVKLTRASDGSFVDGDGMGDGEFAFRVTTVDGSLYAESFTWSEALVGKLVQGKANFP